MGDTSYADKYRNVDFRKHPQAYAIGRGEQGVLIAEPYKSEILPHWKFATPEVAEQSAVKIYQLFLAYGQVDDFVGMDMARKFLQMGFTRSRRYANHASGHKYTVDELSGVSSREASQPQVRPQDAGSEESPKAQSARIFKGYYDKARGDAHYLQLKQRHIQTQLSQQ